MYSSSSRAPSMAAPSITSVRPDLMLEVKCKCDNARKKKITFSSARNCSLFLLQTRVEQCFALRSSSYVIQYKDDDGEIVTIGCESDLTEAIHYFHAPDPDGTSTRDSMSMRDSMSIRSFQSGHRRKITIYVDILLDYDGISLSGESSTGGSDRDERLSLSSEFLDDLILNGPIPRRELDDDERSQRTVSTNPRTNPRTNSAPPSHTSSSFRPDIPSAVPSIHNSRQDSSPSESPSADDERGVLDADDEDNNSRRGVFERMRSQETLQYNRSETDLRQPLNHLEWIRQQQLNTPAAIIHTRLRGSRSHSSISGSSSARLSVEAPAPGHLALQQDPRGKYYYAYTSSRASSVASDSLLDELSLYMANQNEGGNNPNRFSTSTGSSGPPINDHRFSTSTDASNDHRLSASTGVTGSSGLNRHDSIRSANTSLIAQQSVSGHDIRHLNIAPDIPAEVLRFVTDDIPALPPPPDMVTDCSSCGLMLDSFRYVCTTCGEKHPTGSGSSISGSGSASGTGSRTLTPQPSTLHLQTTQLNGSSNTLVNGDEEQGTARTGDFSYPPTHHRSPGSVVSVSSNGSSRADPFNQYPRPVHGPAVTVPGLLLPTSPTSMIASPLTPTVANGYELCPSCMEGAGVFHAMESTTALGVSIGSGSVNGSAYPSSPLSMSSSSSSLDDSLSERRRAAPSRKGQIRHAFVEKVWGAEGWKDIEQDDDVDACSICNTSLAMKRYKCASCTNFNLCRACYSQVHEIHPSHAFLVVPEKQAGPEQELQEIIKVKQPRESMMSMTSIVSEEESLRHPDVKCAHCMQDIIGARFHCAICDDVDICANCESAGLPGNMTSIDGGHNYKHIMIKIPYPLNTKEVQSASQHALTLWTRRDSRHLSSLSRRSRPRSEHSSHARTVIGTPVTTAPPLPDNASDQIRIATEASLLSHRMSTSTSGSRSSAPMSIVSNNASERGAQNGASFGPLDHKTRCKNCRQPIVGVRYQCATCPSNTSAYNLCAQCEPKSYFIHPPQHIFFKLPRPVERPIKSPFPFMPFLYRQPAGTFPDGRQDPENPRAYLQHVNHPSALCDFCMERIVGEWFRCVYCGKDLCASCEAMDTHDHTHFFMVFKSTVDMTQLSSFSDLERPQPLIPYKVY